MACSLNVLLAHSKFPLRFFRTSAGTEHLIPFLSNAKFLLDFDVSGNVTRHSFNSSDGPEVTSPAFQCPGSGA